MAAVKIESGEFPLMRNADISHQPSRSRIYSAWSKAFNSQVPWALNAVADVIEDVFRYELWKDNFLATPQEFFDQIGLGRLNLDDPAKLIHALREMPTGATAEQVNDRVAEMQRQQREWTERREAGESLRAIAAHADVSPQTVLNRVSNKSVMTQKVGQPRQRTTYQITHYTKPETAAAKIRATFGNDFALALGTLLVTA